jgi:hypothetical protein
MKEPIKEHVAILQLKRMLEKRRNLISEGIDDSAWGVYEKRELQIKEWMINDIIEDIEWIIGERL